MTTLNLSPDQLRAVASAIQWAGHFALQQGCQAAGPALSDIAAATAAIEGAGIPVYHARATRDALAQGAGQ